MSYKYTARYRVRIEFCLQLGWNQVSLFILTPRSSKSPGLEHIDNRMRHLSLLQTCRGFQHFFQLVSPNRCQYGSLSFRLITSPIQAKGSLFKKTGCLIKGEEGRY